MSMTLKQAYEKLSEWEATADIDGDTTLYVFKLMGVLSAGAALLEDGAPFTEWAEDQIETVRILIGEES